MVYILPEDNKLCIRPLSFIGFNPISFYDVLVFVADEYSESVRYSEVPSSFIFYKVPFTVFSQFQSAKVEVSSNL
jgi:hypothetical protein